MRKISLFVVAAAVTCLAFGSTAIAQDSSDSQIQVPIIRPPVIRPPEVRPPVLPPDTDEDGVADFIDNCPDVYNPEQTDSDNDGVGDDCEVDEVPVEGEADSDGDGIPDIEDNCIDVENADQADEDGDGVGDLCDADYLDALPDPGISFEGEGDGGGCSLGATSGGSAAGLAMLMFSLLPMAVRRMFA